ncbi:alcohol dehydrogenase catalytic domain-containing protein [Kitasatospora sp. NPDC048540]
MTVHPVPALTPVPRTMAALRIEAPDRVVPARLPVPVPGPGEALIRTALVGLCGTDLELLRGTATYLRDGRAGYPLVPGHEWTGTVVTGGPEFAPGDRVVGRTMVHCGLCRSCRRGRRELCERLTEVGLYGRQGAAAEYLTMPQTALVRVPDEVGDRAAALVEPAVTVVGALERANCRLEDRVAVVGTGTIGLLAVQLAARLAGSVDAVGIDPAGLALALRFGARRAFAPAGAADREYSLVVEASGAAPAFRRALGLLADGGRLAVIGVAGEPAEGFVPGELALRGLSVTGVRHGVDHYDQTLELFRSGVLDAEPLIAAELPPAEGPSAFDRLRRGRAGAPKILLDFGGTR